MIQSKSILLLSPYPWGAAPSQRFRYEHYLIREEVTHAPFWSVKSWEKLYASGHWGHKIRGLLSGYTQRLLLLTRLHRYTLVYIHREATPLGPPIFEWLIARVWRKPIVYDFDDAIWLPNTSRENRWAAWLKWPGKVRWICRWSRIVSCGNDYLADYARQYAQEVRVIPTVVDTQQVHNRLKEQSQRSVVVGWTGSHSTLPYLQPLVPLLQDLEQDLNFETVVIADKDPKLPLKGYRFVPWTKNTEVDDLLQLDIGLMPLEDNAWARGKCGFKAIQYLSLGIPAVVSPVGVNPEIVQHSIHGFQARQPEDWKKYLRQLIRDRELRTEMGRKGRKQVVEQYSVRATRPAFQRLLQDALSSHT